MFQLQNNLNSMKYAFIVTLLMALHFSPKIEIHFHVCSDIKNFPIAKSFICSVMGTDHIALS